MNNRINISDYRLTRNKVLIECCGDSYNHDNSDAIATSKILEAFLIDQFNFVEKKDYTVTRATYGTVSIEVTGEANVILALNMLQSKKKIFKLLSTSFTNEEYERMFARRIGEYITEALEDEKLPRGEAERLQAITKEWLDSIYKLLQAEPIVQTVVNKTVNEQINGQLLKHPFYQLLSLIMEDYNSRVSHYKDKGFFEKIGAKKPDDKAIASLFEKYKFMIPTCYCKIQTYQPSGYKEKLSIDSSKISASTKFENPSSSLSPKSSK